jgi:predicted permease
VNEAALRSIRQAVRRLLRAPAFTVATVLTLMLGIGATTAVFSLVNGVLIRPLPHPEGNRLVDLSHTLVVSGILRVDQSDATYLHYRRANSTFTDVGAYRATAANVGPLSGSSSSDPTMQAERVSAAQVSAGLFGVLRAQALRGRLFTDRDDDPAAPPVVLLAQTFWERKYGADPGVLGRRLEIDGVVREIVGIMPASFRFPASRTDLWVPIGVDPANTRSAAFDYRGVARLRNGVSIAAATADLQRLLPQVPVAFPGRLTVAAIAQTQMRAVVRPLRDVVVGDVGRVLWVAIAAVGFVLLIACANVANLFLVRAEARQHELTVRRALGAGRGAMLAEFLSEGLILAGLGGLLGVALAVAGVRVLRSLEGGIGIPRLQEIGVDARVLAVAAAITILAALLVSAFPALRSAASGLSAALTGTSRTATAERARNRARQALVAVQVALALVLLVGAGLMARSFAALRSTPAGFTAESAFTFRLTLPGTRYETTGSAARSIVRIIDDLAALPGVQAVGVVSKLPLDDEARRDTALFVEDRPIPAGSFPNIHQVSYASPGYFAALRIPVVAGRAFEPPDPARAPREVMVSRSLARRYWNDGRAIGRRVRMTPNGAWYTIVGMTGDVRGTTLDADPDETIYLPLVTTPRDTEGEASPPPMWTPREIAFVVRRPGDVGPVAGRIDDIVRRIDPALPVYRARMMDDLIDQATVQTTFTLFLLGIASAIALALGAVGIYGVISYVVSLRTREIAVRLALGARPADVGRMVASQALVVATVGVGVGIVAAIGATRALDALLFGVSPTDPLTFAGTVLTLLAVALAASWLPARRAANVEPARALAAE